MPEYHVPGVYKQDVYPDLPPGLYTGVPALMGFAVQGPDEPYLLRLGSQFEEIFGAPYSNGHLACAVRGFFENGGSLCYVLRLDGVLSFDDELVARLDRGELLTSGEPAEVEIRAVAVHAVELLGQRLRATGHPRATSGRLDYVLWNRGGDAAYKARPRHRCRCVFY